MKTTIKITILILLLATSNLFGGQLASLYSDHKSFSIGDVITVMIVEETSAQSSANSQTAKSSSHKMNTAAGQGPMAFIPLSSFDLGTGNSAKGDAKTARSAKIKGKMTARIIAIDKNNNLVIKGEKRIKINGEEEITMLEGIIRPQDVSSENSVYSYSIADSKITYKGKGAVNDGAKIGFLNRIFNFIF